jgi:hypothetical protein
MSTLAIEQSPRARPRLVAPIWHTVALVALFLLLALGGANLQQHAAARSADLPRAQSPAVLYLSLIAMEWGLVYYVWKAGLRRTGTSLRELIGGRWRSARAVGIDALLALAAWGVWTLVDLLWERVSGADHAASVAANLPRQPIEVALWIALSMSAGFAEELVFRGYLQRQFHALTRSAVAALFLQALLFGVSHGYQGVRACLKISAYGLLFGTLALSRKSLRPGMAAHAWTDVAAGIFHI